MLLLLLPRVRGTWGASRGGVSSGAVAALRAGFGALVTSRVGDGVLVALRTGSGALVAPRAGVEKLAEPRKYLSGVPEQVSGTAAPPAPARLAVRVRRGREGAERRGRAGLRRVARAVHLRPPVLAQGTLLPSVVLL